jgi:hypothetical protein
MFDALRSWLCRSRDRARVPGARKRSGRRLARAKPRLEQLEDRLTPSLSPVGNSTAYPYSAVVELQTTWQDGSTSVGSGELIDSFHVLTAGHCVYDYAHGGSPQNPNGGYAAKIVVTPALNGNSAPFGTASMVWERVPSNFQQIDMEYPTTFFNDTSDTDIGLITLNKAIGNLTGTIPSLFDFSGQQITGFYNSLPVGTAGYPAPYDDNGNPVILHSGVQPSGSTMYQEPGTITGVTSDGFEFYYSQSSLETHPGQSGSPIWMNTFGNNFATIGIVVSGNNSVGYGTVITSDCYNWIESCLQADANFSPLPAAGSSTESLFANPASNDQTVGALSSFQSTPTNAYSATGTQPSPGATTTTLSAAASSVEIGQPAQFTAVVASSVSHVPTGTVTFYDGTTALGTVSLVTNAAHVTSATLSTSALPPGVQTITAVYNGDSNDLGGRSAALTETATALTLGSLSTQEWSVNQAGYRATISISNGTAPYRNLQVNGLPAGVVASLSGGFIVLSGTPTQAGTFNNIVVSLVDSTGASATERYTLAIEPPPSPTILVTTTSDATTHTGESLRDAVAQADSDAAKGRSDSIGFAAALGGQTIALVQGPLVLSGTGTITIDGGGQITVNGNNAIGFQVDGGATVVLSGLTVTDGGISNGQAFQQVGGNLTLNNCIIGGGPGTGVIPYQGAIYSNGTLTVSDCLVTGVPGDGIWNDGTATVTNSTINGNTGRGIINAGDLATAHLTLSNCAVGGNSGGGIYNGAFATLTGCTVSGNTAAYGGGIDDNSGTLTLIDSTVSDNSADDPAKGAGGISITDDYAKVTLINCTVGGNSAVGKGGGIYNGYPNDLGGTPSVLTLENTIVAGNYAASAPDVDTNPASGATVAASYSLIGNTAGSAITGGPGNILNPSSVGLGGLGSFGGPTQTMALLAGSPAIGAGTVVAGITTDQRGLPRPGTPDMGAYQTQPPVSLAVSAPSTVTAGTAFSVTVTAKDRYGNIATGYTGSVTLTASNGQAVTPSTVALSNGSATVSVTLDTAGAVTLAATAGALKGSSGRITVSPAPAASLVVSAPSTATAGTGFRVTITAKDPYGNTAASYSGTVTLSSSDGQAVHVYPATVRLVNGPAAVTVTLDTADTVTLTASAGTIKGVSGGILVSPVLITVTTASDATVHAGTSLRDAINRANAYAKQGITDTVVFDTAQMGTNTITLQQGQLLLGAGSGTITVNGGGQVTVSGNNASRVFEIGAGSVTISGLTITGGSSPSGGGVLNLASLTLNQDVLTGNHESTGGNGGGAVLSWGGGSSLTVNQTTISNNSAAWTGGGISLIDGGTLLLTNSTVSGNTSSRDGGGITLQSISHNVSATVENCTIANNTAGQYSGGGILNIGYGGGTSATLTILDSTIAGNNAPYAGGVSSWAGSGTVTTKYGNTIFAGNANGNVPYQSGTLTSLGHNLSSDGTGNLTAAGDRPNTAALLAPLGNYGGPTQTMALLSGSAAIDAGDPNQLGVADQRGVVRTGGVNIGAYQASASAFVLTAPASVTAGTPFTLSVTAVDAFGQVAVGYRGTVQFGSSDAAATLPAAYTFTAGDNGVHHFVGLVLRTKGRQTITATDTLVALILGSVAESVL